MQNELFSKRPVRCIMITEKTIMERMTEVVLFEIKGKHVKGQ